MAADTIVLQNRRVLRLDADRLRKILQREALRVPESVLGLRNVLADEIVRQMAVDAFRVSVMTRMLPAVVLLAHDVAIDARFRVAAEIGAALTVPERVNA